MVFVHDLRLLQSMLNVTARLISDHITDKMFEFELHWLPTHQYIQQYTMISRSLLIAWFCVIIPCQDGLPVLATRLLFAFKTL